MSTNSANRYEMKNGPVIDGVTALVTQGAWSGTMTELLKALKRIIPGDALPKSASYLSAELRVWADVLERLGVNVSFGRIKRQKLVYLKPVEPHRCACCGEAALQVCFEAA